MVNMGIQPEIRRQGSVIYLDCLQGSPRRYMPYDEKRIGERTACQEPVSVENCETGEVITGSMYNYSITGFYFEADLPMVPGTQVRLFSEDDNLEPGLNHIRGKVRWYQEIAGAVVLHAYGYGVEYDRPLAEDKNVERHEDQVREPDDQAPVKKGPHPDVPRYVAEDEAPR